MQLCFVPPSMQWLKAASKLKKHKQRNTLRLPSRKNVNNHDNGVDSYLRTEYRVDTYHIQNLEFLDRAYDFDEFQDIDNEHAGLTITEPMDEVATFHYLTGYDII